MIGDTIQHIGEPGAGIDIVESRRDDERVHGCGSFTAAIGRGLIVPWFRERKSSSDTRFIP